MSPYCSDCGAQVRQMDSYCWQCGSELEFVGRSQDEPRKGVQEKGGGRDSRGDRDVGGDAEQGDSGFGGGAKSSDDGFGSTTPDQESPYQDVDSGGRGFDRSSEDHPDADGTPLEDDGFDGSRRREDPGFEGDGAVWSEGEDDGSGFGERSEEKGLGGSGGGDGFREEPGGARGEAVGEGDDLDSELNRLDETPSSADDLERSDPPWKETSSSDLQASGSVDEDRPRYVKTEGEGSDPRKTTGKPSARTYRWLGVVVAAAGLAVAVVAHDQLHELTGFAGTMAETLPQEIAEDDDALRNLRTGGVAAAVAGAAVAVYAKVR